LPTGDQRVRRFGADHPDRIRPFQALYRFFDRFAQRIGILELIVDQMDDDFGISLRSELIAFGSQFFAQGFVVFDDAVVDQGHDTAGNVGMSVAFARNAMGRPTRMGDAGRASTGACGKRRFEFSHLALLAAALYLALL
jgi:hypothetical protein